VLMKSLEKFNLVQMSNKNQVVNVDGEDDSAMQLTAQKKVSPKKSELRAR